MSEPFVGEIRAWAMPWAPSGWAACNGQQVPVVQAQALFALIANLYGAATQQLFFLPDLRSKVPMAAGTPNATLQGQGMPAAIPVAQKLGSASAGLVYSNLPVHNHQVSGATTAPTNLVPMVGEPTADSYLSRLASPGTGTNPPTAYASWSNQQTPDQKMHQGMIGMSGGGGTHENRQPFLTVNFCIALTGVFPTRN